MQLRMIISNIKWIIDDYNREKQDTTAKLPWRQNTVHDFISD